MLRRFILRVRALLRRSALEEDLDEELRYHLENEVARNVAAGMSPADARHAARRAFGNAARHKDDVRATWGWAWLEQRGQDLRYAARAARRAATFSATVVLTISLGLGSLTTAFTVFNAYVLRPAAVRDPNSLYEFQWLDRTQTRHDLTWPQFEALSRQSEATGFTETFAHRPFLTRINGDPAIGELVTGNYFRALGVGAEFGRTLLPEDAPAPGAAPVIVLSHRAWTTRFGADSQIVGKTVRIRGVRLVVVGVARAGFEGLSDGPMDFWLPFTIAGEAANLQDVFGDRPREVLRVIGRLRERMGVDQVQTRLGTWARTLTADHLPADRAVGVTMVSKATNVPITSELMLIFSPIVAAFVLVMVIACANVANMMLARGMARQREIGVRLSLGASRARLVRQLLTEAVLLAVPAAAAGYAISRASIDLGGRLMYMTMPPEIAPFIRVLPLLPDGRVFAFMVAAAVGAALLFGLAPALQATRANVVQATRGDVDTDHRPSRLRNGLVLAQITFSVLLLICAGILLRGARKVQQLETGIRSRDIVELNINDRFRERALAQLRATPRVQAMAVATSGPLDGQYPSLPVAASGGRLERVFANHVSASFFDILEVPLVRGRPFTIEEERSRAPVAIVSETMARALWPGVDAVGQTLRVASDSAGAPRASFDDDRTTRVIGVARDAAAGTIVRGVQQAILYRPIAIERGGSILVRVAGGADLARQSFDTELARIDSSTVERASTLEAARFGAVWVFQSAYWVCAALGVIALVLTATGVSGVLSYVVAQRRKELGIRVALGASRERIVRLVLTQSLRVALYGLGLGGALALGASRIFASRLVFIDTVDPLAYGGALLLVVACCLVAAYVPSRRAAGVDPMEALRAE